ncbi:cytochrome-c oxidase, cbb3-type subunit III [Maritimibacter fusiformis]|jgi:cytochrome c oxidase cbb3-type subunit 3|uniref:Cbb3-type cytochrome c oxidase subunit n=1 Tax=Maritimibacter fusiformis TaxID=2603819 RepID=A0A5D0RKZ0_9RHOB|nr:cytochrome-c oxidase, cbb3-type subunit III [Maritimibacter fusiformis]TYB82103.1 cytochrome-c oxidase, cbb3-type subunit III [Maritimibacter fusiformis]
MSKDKEKDEVQTTGHEWDGIQEFNNPLPRWWLWVFYATIVWGIGYFIAYPAWPMITKATPGLIGFSTRANVQEEIDRFAEMNAEVRAQLASADLTTLADDTEVYNFAIQSGRATFATFCSQCHGSGAAGAKGYPNLLDNDWIWGGEIEDIAYSIRHGIRNLEDDDARYSEMPAFGDDYLSDEEISQVVAYVMSLSPVTRDAADMTLAAEGETVFADNCASCHMEDGTGDRAQGAPNLTDAIWLYGSDQAEIEASVRNGPFGVMPAWGSRLDEAEVKAVAAYVHQLGGGE